MTVQKIQDLNRTQADTLAALWVVRQGPFSTQWSAAAWLITWIRERHNCFLNLTNNPDVDGPIGVWEATFEQPCKGRFNYRHFPYAISHNPCHAVCLAFLMAMNELDPKDSSPACLDGDLISEAEKQMKRNQRDGEE